MLKGKPVFLYNFFDLQRVRWEGADALTPAKHTLEFDFKYDGLGAGTLAFNKAASVAAAPACSRLTARRWHARPWSTPSR